ncbi:MAG: methyltransferase domain-containing protein [Akkermansiaceae bacterium]
MFSIRKLISDKFVVSHRTSNWLQHRLMERYYINGPINSLAIGTGGGPEVLRLSERGNFVTAVEHDALAKDGISKQMARYPDLDKWNCEVTAIEDFATSKFYHFVLMSQVLEHIQNDDQVIQKLSSITAPHARLIISTPTSLDGLLGRESIVVPVATGPDHVRVGYQGPELDFICTRFNFFLIKRFYLGNPLLATWLLFEEKHAHNNLMKIINLIARPLVLSLSLWRYRSLIQISIYTRMH